MLRRKLSTMGVEREVRLELKKMPKGVGSSPQTIEQFFVLKDDLTYVRLRRLEVRGRESFYLTLKFGEQPGQIESTTEVTKEVWEYYKENHIKGDSYQMKKRYNYLTWTIDVVEEGKHKGKIFAELELTDDSQSFESVGVPPQFEVKKKID